MGTRVIERATAVDDPSVGRLNVRRARIAGGFTLIEAIAAIVVLAVAIPAIIMGVAGAHRHRSTPPLFERARWLAAERLEDVIADRHSVTRGYAYVTNANYPAESVITGFAGYSRTTSITETGPNLVSAGTGYKIVRVTVAFPNPVGAPLSFAVSTVLTDYAP